MANLFKSRTPLDLSEGGYDAQGRRLLQPAAAPKLGYLQKLNVKYGMPLDPATDQAIANAKAEDLRNNKIMDSRAMRDERSVIEQEIRDKYQQALVSQLGEDGAKTIMNQFDAAAGNLVTKEGVDAALGIEKGIGRMPFARDTSFKEGDAENTIAGTGAEVARALASDSVEEATSKQKSKISANQAADSDSQQKRQQAQQQALIDDLDFDRQVMQVERAGVGEKALKTGAEQVAALEAQKRVNEAALAANPEVYKTREREAIQGRPIMMNQGTSAAFPGGEVLSAPGRDIKIKDTSGREEVISSPVNPVIRGRVQSGGAVPAAPQLDRSTFGVQGTNPLGAANDGEEELTMETVRRMLMNPGNIPR